MQLARAVAARALTDWEEPEQSAAPDPQANPAPVPPTDPAPAAARLRSAGTSLRVPTCKPIDPALLFTRLAATVRDCIALEARLAAGPAPTARAAALALRADPRRAPLRDVFQCVTENHPERAELRREIDTRLDETLAADPDHTLEAPEIFLTMCDELGIEIDLATLPDAYLDFIINVHQSDAEINKTPDPRATSPP